MKKSIIALLVLTIVMSVFSVFPVFAEESLESLEAPEEDLLIAEDESLEPVPDYISDTAGKLAESEIEELNAFANEKSKLHAVSIAAIMTDNVGGMNDDDFAYTYLEQNALDEKAVALLVNFKSRMCTVITVGDVKNEISESDLNVLLDTYTSALTYYDGVKSYIAKVDEMLSDAGVIPEIRQLPRVVDYGDILSPEEEAALLSKLDTLSEKLGFDIVVATNFSLKGKSATAYADDYFDYNGFGYGQDRDGILFLLSMEERDWAISTSGFGINAFTDYGQNMLTEKMLPHLRNGNYYEAFDLFADECEDYVNQARTGEPYDIKPVSKAPAKPWSTSRFVICLIVGYLIATLVMSGKKAQYKTVRVAATAENYAVRDSMKISRQNELFLYHNVARSSRMVRTDHDPRGGGFSGGSSTHISSSGTTHGGSSGKF